MTSGRPLRRQLTARLLGIDTPATQSGAVDARAGLALREARVMQSRLYGYAAYRDASTGAACVPGAVTGPPGEIYLQLRVHDPTSGATYSDGDFRVPGDGLWRLVQRNPDGSLIYLPPGYAVPATPTGRVAWYYDIELVPDYTLPNFYAIRPTADGIRTAIMTYNPANLLELVGVGSGVTVAGAPSAMPSFLTTQTTPLADLPDTT
jgi:hypothetical protein